jgi:hypothetical protein
MQHVNGSPRVVAEKAVQQVHHLPSFVFHGEALDVDCDWAWANRILERESGRSPVSGKSIGPMTSYTSL